MILAHSISMYASRVRGVCDDNHNNDDNGVNDVY